MKQAGGLYPESTGQLDQDQLVNLVFFQGGRSMLLQKASTVEEHMPIRGEDTTTHSHDYTLRDFVTKTSHKTHKTATLQTKQPCLVEARDRQDRQASLRRRRPSAEAQDRQDSKPIDPRRDTCTYRIYYTLRYFSPRHTRQQLCKQQPCCESIRRGKTASQLTGAVLREAQVGKSSNQLTGAVPLREARDRQDSKPIDERMLLQVRRQFFLECLCAGEQDSETSEKTVEQHAFR